MAGKNSKLGLLLINLVIFAMIFSPMLPCEASRFPANGLDGVMKVKRPLCPACVCCAPAPPGGCCPCLCPNPVASLSGNGSP